MEQSLGIPLLHDTALQRIKKIGQKRWNEIHTFTVVRHPYHRVASLYRFRRMRGTLSRSSNDIGPKEICINEWIREAFEIQNPDYRHPLIMLQPCMHWIADSNGNILVNQVMMLESISEDWAEFCRMTGHTKSLGWVNKTQQSATSHEALSPQSKTILNNYFASDFERLGYKPEPC